MVKRGAWGYLMEEQRNIIYQRHMLHAYNYDYKDMSCLVSTSERLGESPMWGAFLE